MSTQLFTALAFVACMVSADNAGGGNRLIRSSLDRKGLRVVDSSRAGIKVVTGATTLNTLEEAADRSRAGIKMVMGVRMDALNTLEVGIVSNLMTKYHCHADGASLAETLADIKQQNADSTGKLKLKCAQSKDIIKKEWEESKKKHEVDHENRVEQVCESNLKTKSTYQDEHAAAMKVYFQEMADAKKKFDLVVAAASQKEAEAESSAEQISGAQLGQLTAEYDMNMEEINTNCTRKTAALMKEESIVKELQTKLSELSISITGLLQVVPKTVEHPNEKFPNEKFETKSYTNGEMDKKEEAAEDEKAFTKEDKVYTKNLRVNSTQKSFQRPEPVFRTNYDIEGAIENCIILSRTSPGRCSLVHLTPYGVYLDRMTSSSLVANQVSGELIWTKQGKRLAYIVNFLRMLHIKRNSTMVFFLADTPPDSFKGFPIILHTVERHEDAILFPTPYMLRDLDNGHLAETLKFCDSSVYKPLKERRNDVFFRGASRGNFRLGVKNYYGGGDATLRFDVEFTRVPNDSLLEPVKASPWTEKFKHEYLLTLKGGWSSQWGVYHDFVARGVIVRQAIDKKEYWNYDLIANHPGAFVTFDNIESIKAAVLDKRVQASKQRMANFTAEAACMLLQPKEIIKFGNKFVDKYSLIFSDKIIHGHEYNLPSVGRWKAELMPAPPPGVVHTT